MILFLFRVKIISLNIYCNSSEGKFNSTARKLNSLCKYYKKQQEIIKIRRFSQNMTIKVASLQKSLRFLNNIDLSKIG